LSQAARQHLADRRHQQLARDDQLLHMIALVASNAEKPSALDEERPSAIPLLPVSQSKNRPETGARLAARGTRQESGRDRTRLISIFEMRDIVNCPMTGRNWSSKAPALQAHNACDAIAGGTVIPPVRACQGAWGIKQGDRI
jgi:hypothetical protein